MVVRGNIIHSSRFETLRQERQTELEVAFYEASDAFKRDPSHTTRQSLANTRLELDMLLTELAEEQLRQTRHLFHLL